MFVTYNKVRMHDTDMAGILYFAKQFRYVHDALEDLIEKEGFNFHDLFNNSEFVFVIVHAEADYLSSVQVGDVLEIRVEVERLGNTSFTMAYEIFKADGVLMGKAKTVHVCLESKTRPKIPIPQSLKKIFQKYTRKAES
ncbi:MAG: acyl-CoA thioesterase [Parachlamydiaceae bacterium]|nr:MAG: acyl-CoA thioesterase [Parachlamydiaceae bacterium]